MKLFFLMTRGRTGSSAIIDELKMSINICAMQELFIRKPDPNDYKQLLPFDLWKKKNWLLKIPFLFSKTDETLINFYLNNAQKNAMNNGSSAFGFKILSHFFEQRPFLLKILREQGYSAVYLTRNPARQVLSGMVANAREIFNTKERFQDMRRYRIDVDAYRQLVEWEIYSVEKDQALLRSQNIEFISVSYEDFIKNRNLFYNNVLGFLGLPQELPPKSNFSIMIKNIRYTVENYEAILELASNMGWDISE